MPYDEQDPMMDRNMKKGGDHDSSYMQMAIGGKVASELLRRIGQVGGGTVPGMVAGLVGKLAKHRASGKGVKAAGGRMQPVSRSSPKPAMGPGPYKPVTSGTSPAAARKAAKPKSMPRGGIGQGQTAASKKAIIEGIMEDERNIGR